MKRFLFFVVLLLFTSLFSWSGSKQPAYPIQPEGTETIHWLMPAYIREVKIYAVKVGGMPQEKPKRIRPYGHKSLFSGRDSAGSFCNGSHLAPSGYVYDCTISDAMPVYDYFIQAWDRFGDPAPGYICKHLDDGWRCKLEGTK